VTQPEPARRHTVDTAQLLNLADRAERGPLTGDEAARLRDGITLLAELLHDAEGDRDSWARDAKRNETEADALRRERHTYQKAWRAARERARKEHTRAERAEAKLERVHDAVDSVRRAMVYDPRDWSQYKRDAWTYGVIVGWTCEDQHDHDDICGADDALNQVVRQHGWLPEDVARLKTYRAAIAALDEQQEQQP
jgi:hypothetical protein